MNKLFLIVLLGVTSVVWAEVDTSIEKQVCGIKIYKKEINSLEKCAQGDIVAFTNYGMEWELRWLAKIAAICEFDSIKMSVSESTVSGFCHYRGKENTLKIRETNKWVTGIVIE
jgi:hypothetical protein|tara:strand:- start:1310 stop:1651 length:342 start_codon:yes stop_codon:yes gene_type:complete